MALRALKGIKQLRFLLCQHSQASSALRNYIANNYEAIRTSPATVTVRECEYVSPTVIATYSFGIEKKIDLTKRPESEIEKTIADLEANSQKIASQIRI